MIPLSPLIFVLFFCKRLSQFTEKSPAAILILLIHFTSGTVKTPFSGFSLLNETICSLLSSHRIVFDLNESSYFTVK